MVNENFNELLAKELSGEISLHERQEFLLLIEHNDAYKQEYELLKSYWLNSDTSLGANHDLFAKVENKIKLYEQSNPAKETVDNEHVSKSNSLPFYWLKFAAILLIVFGLSFYFYTNYPGIDSNIHLVVKSTGNSVRSKLTLSDGTRIILNSGSELKFKNRFDGETREVYLTGEAYFDVHRDTKHPFIIHTTKMDVQVLGTSFNVKAYPNGKNFETTLIHGSVKVTLADHPADAIILKPNEKLTVKNIPDNDQKALPSSVTKDVQYAVTTITYLTKKDNIILETSWLKNKLAFNNDDFVSVANQMERWYGVKIDITDKEIRDYRFTALFEKETLKEALDALQLTEDFNYKIENSTVHIYK